MTVETPIPTIVIDDTAIKRRGVCEFVEETSLLRLYAQVGDAPERGDQAMRDLLMFSPRAAPALSPS